MTEYRVETVEMGSGLKSKDPRQVIEGVLRRPLTKDGDLFRPASKGAVSWRAGPCSCSSNATRSHEGA
jgi:hypothetical protein